MSKVTVRQAALLTEKSRETINNATKDGTISFTLNEKSHKVIDISELQRVYPIVKSMEDIEKSDTVKSSQNRTVNSQSDLEKEVSMLKERLESISREGEQLKLERNRERRQLESEIENLRSNLERAQEQHGKAMLLLTDQRKNEEGRGLAKMEQDKKLDALEETIKLLRNQNKRILKEMDEQKNKSIWQRLVG